MLLLGAFVLLWPWPANPQTSSSQKREPHLSETSKENEFPPLCHNELLLYTWHPRCLGCPQRQLPYLHSMWAIPVLCRDPLPHESAGMRLWQHEATHSCLPVGCQKRSKHCFFRSHYWLDSWRLQPQSLDWSWMPGYGKVSSYLSK